MEKQITIPETVIKPLRPYWRWWNLGHYAYFRRERTLGNAKLDPWVISEADAQIEFMKMQIRSSSGGRWVPQGEYVRLLKLQIDALEIIEEGPIWQTVMSDTPDEFNDHAEPILNAHGRVLIHGLGLGCLLNCIRQRPNVTHIDVVEVDEDVLNLISPFYARDDRVKFHLGSCVDIKWPKGTRWNYVWHDIWTTISDKNLTNDEEAEHGISYARLHRKFANRCDQQGSWAFHLARNMRSVHRLMEELASRFAAKWQISTPEERLKMLVEVTCPTTFPLEQWKHFMLDSKTREFMGNQEMYINYVERSQNGSMSDIEAYVLIEDQARRYAMKKVGVV
jgi:hypothetical protein